MKATQSDRINQKDSSFEDTICLTRESLAEVEQVCFPRCQNKLVVRSGGSCLPSPDHFFVRRPTPQVPLLGLMRGEVKRGRERGEKINKKKLKYESMKMKDIMKRKLEK